MRAGPDRPPHATPGQAVCSPAWSTRGGAMIADYAREARVRLRIAAAVLLFAACAASAPAAEKTARAAHAQKPAAPAKIASFGDWRLATHGSGAARVCYAYTRANPKTPLPGRGEVALTVTERPSLRDAVAISAGFALTSRDDVQLQAGAAKAAFYPAGRQVFARDTAAALALLGRGGSASLAFPVPKGGVTADRFSLTGFADALAAARAACPAAAAGAKP